ncbi:MAG: acetate/propionate family kinase [Alphaproteobacteria bacterium]|nr:acetate/propionate family kinase [Alphaproteobacteria bacterium]
MRDCIIVVNAGSSSVKFSLFSKTEKLDLLATGKVADIGDAPVFSATSAETERETRESLPAASTHEQALRHILQYIEAQKHGAVSLAAHRIVHGGTVFAKPCAITPEVLEQLRALVPLAPLHQPHNIAAVEILGRLMPDMPQIACFDTGFHAGRSALFDSYAVPESLREKGIRRYGFHGLSYEWIAQALARDYPALAKGRVVAAHLGNGASLCAMKDGKSVDTTMGMTALEGLPMGTRSGSIDPGAVVFMLRELGMSADEAEHALYHDCGLLGLSGLSNDVKKLLEDGGERPRFALDYFSLKTAQFICAMAASLGGLETLVFTGGIGENAAPVRDAILRRLSFLPSFEMLVIPANEERVMAQHALANVK